MEKDIYQLQREEEDRWQKHFREMENKRAQFRRATAMASLGAAIAAMERKEEK